MTTKVLKNAKPSDAPAVKKARIILMGNEKGGVSKSCVATNLAISLAQKNKVLALDLDKQSAMEAFFLDYKYETPNLTHKHIPAASLGSLPKILNEYLTKVDYIILDVAGGDITTLLSSFGYVDWMITPCIPTRKALAATTAFLILLAKRGDFVANPNLRVAILMNQVSYHPLNTIADKAVSNFNDLIAACNLQDRIQVLDTRLTLSTAWIEAEMEEIAISDMPKTKSAKQWDLLLKELKRKGVLR